MSLHKSLKTSDELARRRNVLTRAERLAAMKERGIWKEDGSVLGLPKLRTLYKMKKRKKKEAADEKAAEETAGEAGEGKEASPGS
jgi:small basic protein (TIGR04137 family)